MPSLNRKMGALMCISLLVMIWGYQIGSLAITKHQLGFIFVDVFFLLCTYHRIDHHQTTTSWEKMFGTFSKHFPKQIQAYVCVFCFFFVRAFGHFFRGGEWDVRKPPQAFTFRVCDECPFLGGF